jgi:hypothetical protein
MNPPPGNDDEPLLSTLKPMGREEGQPNFRRGNEDVMLASAYVVMTSNATISTDQNGATFWDKILESILQRVAMLDAICVPSSSLNRDEQVHRYLNECSP